MPAKNYYVVLGVPRSVPHSGHFGPPTPELARRMHRDITAMVPVGVPVSGPARHVAAQAKSSRSGAWSVLAQAWSRSNALCMSACPPLPAWGTVLEVATRNGIGNLSAAGRDSGE